jgi:hypothetical protein
VPSRLRLGLLLAVLGAVLVAIGPELGVVPGGPPPGYGSGPLLILLALLPALLAVGLVLASQPIAAAGVLVGVALLASGRALLDFQLAVDALAVSRPELLIPTTLSPLSSGTGLWLLLAGHGVTMVAGLLAAGRAGAEPGSAMAMEFEESTHPVPGLDLDSGADDPVGRDARPATVGLRGRLGWVLAAAVITALGLLMPPFRSDDAFQPARDLTGGPTLVMVGGMLISVAVLLACVIAASTAPRILARGVLLGVSAAALGVLVPAQAAGFLVDRLSPDWRSFLAIVGILGLVALAVWPTTAGRDARGGPSALSDETWRAGRLHVAAGVLGLLAAAAAVGGFLNDLLVLEIPEDQPISATDRLYLLSGAQPVTYAGNLLLPVGVLLGVLGVLLLVPRVAPIARPAFNLALVTVPLAGMLAVDAVVTASRTGAAIRPGAGIWLTVSAMVLAAVAVVCALIAGGIERDDVDLSEHRPNLMMAAPATAAVLFAFGAFGLPILEAPDYVPAGVWSEFRLASWGLVLSLVTVVSATVIAVLSRPSRAVALLLGAAAVVGVHLLQWPLTGARVPDSSPGAGAWLSLACVAGLLISAVLAVTARPEPARRPAARLR